MPEEPSQSGEPDRPSAEEIEELARRLRDAEHLTPEVREEMAGLLRELAVALETPDASAHADQLARSAAQLVRALHDQHEPGLIDAARERLEAAVARAESRAPVATDIVLRLIDTLSSLGI
ncbi:MAG: hypothetical protein JWN86_4105 [Planctomycetota bacterium]|nr:hypothetical protein [Planctomycetota bacterium]